MQVAAFVAICFGVACEVVDQAVCIVLEVVGFGFDYRLSGLLYCTGHGCGLAIHEVLYLVCGNVLSF